MHSFNGSKKILLNFFFFLIPFFVYFLIILLIDPYELLNLSSIIPHNIKQRYSPKFNEPLWILNQYDKNPNPNILLGDSRIAQFNTITIKLKTGYEFSNLSFGGANFPEICTVFWYVNEKYKFSKVFIGLNFELFNQFNSRNRVKGVISILNNKLLYFTNINVLQSAFFCLRDYLFNKAAILGAPNMSKKEFWNFQLDNTAVRYFVTVQV